MNPKKKAPCASLFARTQGVSRRTFAVREAKFGAPHFFQVALGRLLARRGVSRQFAICHSRALRFGEDTVSGFLTIEKWCGKPQERRARVRFSNSGKSPQSSLETTESIGENEKCTQRHCTLGRRRRATRSRRRSNFRPTTSTPRARAASIIPKGCVGSVVSQTPPLSQRPTESVWFCAVSQLAREARRVSLGALRAHQSTPQRPTVSICAVGS